MWKNEFEIIDFHSHILPGMDDGAEDISASVAMLSELLSQGVDKVLATSHYYEFREDISSYLSRREEALFKLESHIKEHDIYLPEIVPAAEVRLYHGMWQDENISRLTVADSKYILLEMPYDYWTDWMFSEVYSLMSRGYIPIMAHLERYIDIVPEKEIEQKLLPLGVLVQCNAESFESRSAKKFMKKLLKSGRLTVLGTDCHDMTDRPPHIKGALDYISKKFGDDKISYIMKNAGIIISGNNN